MESLLEAARVKQRIDTLRAFVEWIASRECYCASGHGPFYAREGDDITADLPCDPCRARLVIRLIGAS